MEQTNPGEKSSEKVGEVQEEISEDKILIEQYQNYIQELQLFSDQTKFNAILHQGVSMILEKINKIEARLNEIQKPIQSKE